MRFSATMIGMAMTAINTAFGSAEPSRENLFRPRASTNDKIVRARRTGRVKKFDLDGDNVDVQAFDDEPSYSCRLRPGRRNGNSRGNAKFCTTSGGASVMVLESDEDNNNGNNRGNGNKKQPVASIIDPTTGMTYYKDENGEVTERHSSNFPPEEDADDDTMSARNLRNGLRGAASTDATSLDTTSRQLAEDGSVIDILVIWTQKADAAGNMPNIIDAAIARTNEAFANSGVPTTVRLAHAQKETDGYNEDSLRDALYAIQDTDDGNMDYVHDLRRQYGADLVVLLTNGSGCGIAWINPGYSYAFSVTNWDCAVENLSFAHEIGHNLNCNHDRGTKNCPSGTNYGYRDPDARFRSVMSYSCKSGQCDNNAGGSCTRMPFFSTPDSNYMWDGLPQGDSMTDNASAIRNKMVQVANFEQSILGPLTTTTTAPTTTTTTPTTTAPTTTTTTPTTTTTTTPTTTAPTTTTTTPTTTTTTTTMPTTTTTTPTTTTTTTPTTTTTTTTPTTTTTTTTTTPTTTTTTTTTTPTTTTTTTPTTTTTTTTTSLVPSENELHFTSFEDGWNGWVDGGSDARRSSMDAAYCKNGMYCIRLRDNSGGSSSMTKKFGKDFGGEDMSNYNRLRVEFSFYARSMENNEDFFLEIDNGDGWREVENWRFPSDFANNQFTDTSVVIDPDIIYAGGSFNELVSLRFRCDASANSDMIYIDDVKVVGLSN